MGKYELRSALLAGLLCVLMISFYMFTSHILWLDTQNVTVSAPFIIQDYSK
jgi:hypothetical protein